MKRNIYLEDLPLDEAWRRFAAALQSASLWQPLGTETIPLTQALGRVTAEPVWARISAPHYHASAMDGYALRARDTHEATETNPLQLTLAEAWEDIAPGVRPAQAVNTGAPLPIWADTVVMIEHTQKIGASAIEIRASLAPWTHVRPLGEDMVATELVLPANHKLRPVDLGALAGSGHAMVTVYTRPRVAIIPTGSELVSVEAVSREQLTVNSEQSPVSSLSVSHSPDSALSTHHSALSPGQIIEFNSLVLAGQVEQWGGIPTRWPIVPDEWEKIVAAVKDAAASHDLILVNAGSSAGSKDYTAHVVQELGQLLVHGVAVRPGHPVILGMIERRGDAGTRREGDAATRRHGESVAYSPTRPLAHSLPIIGVPGYPVSAALTGEIFVEPLLARWQGQPAYEPPTLPATLTRKVVSHTGDDDFVRVAVGKVGEKVLATPISRGAGVITSLVRADGIVRIPRFSEGEEAGAQVTVHLYRTVPEIERTILCIGSHDLTLDLMAQFLAERGRRLSSANVGSLGGLVALRRGEAHLAGSHLLDPATGEYNVSYIHRYLPGQKVMLITLVGREQGWIIPPGNPKGIKGWEDSARPDIRLVNRQRGAGTRVLLDYELGQRGIVPEMVTGYEREEYTHLAVAAAISSGTADMGLGVVAAARALQLDFVPLAQERYDLVIPAEHGEGDLLRPLLDLLHDGTFRQAVAQLPGYDVSVMGNRHAL
ncbi:MAG: molybdopterin biosynthesis protein [Chloroflexi bacterium]|nr:molybdopterin biosynthesis protein [Chloroflexota bacterium]MBP8055534.1 molybdopterin biosynthesis protein [Chloroflexota bacterium]